MVLELLSICLFMNACGIAYVTFYLKEVPQRAAPAIGEMELMNENSVASKIPKNDEVQVVRTVEWSEIFNFQILKDSLNVVIRKREYNGRTVVLLLFFITVLYTGIFAGETQLERQEIAYKNWKLTN